MNHNEVKAYVVVGSAPAEGLLDALGECHRWALRVYLDEGMAQNLAKRAQSTGDRLTENSPSFGRKGVNRFDRFWMPGARYSILYTTMSSRNMLVLFSELGR